MGLNLRIGLPGPISATHRFGGNGQARQARKRARTAAYDNASPQTQQRLQSALFWFYLPVGIVLAVLGLVLTFAVSAGNLVLVVLGALGITAALVTRRRQLAHRAGQDAAQAWLDQQYGQPRA